MFPPEPRPSSSSSGVWSRAFRAAAFAAASLSAAAAETPFVSVFGDGLRADGAPVAFACAAGVRLPSPAPSAGPDALKEAEAGARALARELALDGFGMVRVPDLAVPRPGDPAAEARLAVQDAFVAACKDEGLRVWAEVLHPVCDFVPSPAGADALDDPATREAWREAVSGTNAPAASLLLAAPWDPRLEILVQRRLRDWARAFNPHTGLRRCDDPVYALFGFSSLWWEDLDAAALPDLPPFFLEGLSSAWNDWLYERHRSDWNLQERIGLGPGETLASNSVAFPPPELAPGSARAREQRVFLHRLSVDHLRRLLVPFAAFGRASRTAPRLVRHGGPEPFLPDLSTIAVSLGAGTGAATPQGLPLVVDDSLRAPRSPLAAAAAAAAAGADVFVLPAGADPAAWGHAAAAFAAGRSDPAALEAAAHRNAYDFPPTAWARLLVPRPGAEPSVAVFPAAGAAVAVVRAAEDETPGFPPDLATNALPRRFLVCVPADWPEEDPAAAGRPDGSRRPRAALDVSLFAPPARPGSWVFRVRPARSPLPEDPSPRTFSVLACGHGLERRDGGPASGADAVPAGPGGSFRFENLSAPAALLFSPSSPASNLLRGL